MRRLLMAVLGLALAATMPHAFASSARDPLAVEQWAPDLISAPAAWRTTRGKGVIVAILDTGIDLGHPDLKTKLVPGINVVDDAEPPQDDHGHGTHVAGIVAAAAGNGVGIAGIAPDARLMPVKVLDKRGAGTAKSLAAGIRWAASHGAHVINMSLTFDVLNGQVASVSGSLDSVESAIEFAAQKGVVVVAAAGNQSAPLCSYPAAMANVLCVGAVGPDKMRAYYSQGDATGQLQFVCAPGGSNISSGPTYGIGGDNRAQNVLSTVGRGTAMDEKGSGYVAAAGTSMAAPHVAGVAALLRARRLTATATVSRILDTAEDLGVPGHDAVCGAGLVNAAGAVNR